MIAGLFMGWTDLHYQPLVDIFAIDRKDRGGR